MSVEREHLVDAERFRIGHDYVEMRGATPFEVFEADFDSILRSVEKVRPVTAETKIFEVGAGLGWFEVICALRGLSCSAVELSPVNLAYAHELARTHGVEIDVEQGSIEDVDLGREVYDVVIATSVFEHVRRYGRGLAKIYDALRPGGAFYFSSTNKFSLRSGEYPDFPLYGWWPYLVRRRIRVSRQGWGIVESSGMDFNQFTYWGLRRHFESLGYSRVLDRLDYANPGDPWRNRPQALALWLASSVAPMRVAARTFASVNAFICIK